MAHQVPRPSHDIIGLTLLTAIVTVASVAVVTIMARAAPAAPPATAASFVAPTTAPPTLTSTSTGEPDYEATSIYLLTTIPPETPARPTGIFDDQVDFFHEGYRMQNAWQGIVGGDWALVIAGAHSDDLEQGWIFSSWEWPNAAAYGFYKTPLRAGSVRIVDEQNYRLTLVSEKGTTFYWDIPSQSFVDSLTAVAPTITPPPTYIPSAPAAEGGYPAPATTAPEAGYPGLKPTPAP